jgi:hypothetical protein
MTNKTAQDVADGLAFVEVEDLADRAQSYWASIMHAAHRGDRMTVAIHLKQVRLLTFSCVQVVKAIADAESGA